MATIKSYTDIEQSRRLSKILEVDTADCYYPVTYIEESTNKYLMCYIKPYIGRLSEVEGSVDTRLYVPCWSLAALLSILPIIKGYLVEIRHMDKGYCCCYTEENHNGDLYWYYADNPVDACYEMIIKLNELKKL